MTETILTTAAALLVCLINNWYQQRQFEERQHSVAEEANRKHDETIKMIEYKLEQLTKKVDKHNNLVERMYALEKHAEKTNYRLDNLEKK